MSRLHWPPIVGSAKRSVGTGAPSGSLYSSLSSTAVRSVVRQKVTKMYRDGESGHPCLVSVSNVGILDVFIADALGCFDSKAS